MRALRLVVVLALFGAALPVSAATGDLAGQSAAEMAHGAYLLTFDVGGAAQMPAGARIRCKAKVTPHLQNGESVDPQQAAAGIAITMGSKAQCRVELPFSWIVKSGQNGAWLGYQIDVFSADGTRVGEMTEQGLDVSLPRAGTAAQLNFNVRF